MGGRKNMTAAQAAKWPRPHGNAGSRLTRRRCALAAGAAAGGIFGGIVQETAEEAQAGGVPTVLSYSAFAQIYGAARRLNNLIQELE